MVRTIGFALLFLLTCAGQTYASDPIEDLVVMLVDEAVIVSVVEGRVSQVPIEEGMPVDSGDVIVRLEDQKQQINLSLARRDLEMAESIAVQAHGLDSAQAKSDSQQSRIDEHSVRMSQNRSKADNDLQVLAAQKAEAVAKNEWTRARASRRKFSDSVSQSELDSLQLTFERSQLETREARFQQSMSKLDVELDGSVLETLRSQLACGHGPTSIKRNPRTRSINWNPK